jgi:hypothetical protein
LCALFVDQAHLASTDAIINAKPISNGNAPSGDFKNNSIPHPSGCGVAGSIAADSHFVNSDTWGGAGKSCQGLETKQCLDWNRV